MLKWQHNKSKIRRKTQRSQKPKRFLFVFWTASFRIRSEPQSTGFSLQQQKQNKKTRLRSSQKPFSLKLWLVSAKSLNWKHLDEDDNHSSIVFLWHVSSCGEVFAALNGWLSQTNLLFIFSVRQFIRESIQLQQSIYLCLHAEETPADVGFSSGSLCKITQNGLSCRNGCCSFNLNKKGNLITAWIKTSHIDSF